MFDMRPNTAWLALWTDGGAECGSEGRAGWIKSWRKEGFGLGNEALPVPARLSLFMGDFHLERVRRRQASAGSWGGRGN